VRAHRLYGLLTQLATRFNRSLIAPFHFNPPRPTTALRTPHLQKAAVDATLADMGVAHKPRIVMYNKIDALSEVNRLAD
jgi:hypothetical protein